MKRGYKHSPETRAKMSAAKKGCPGHKQSLEARAKMSAALKGRKFTLEHRAKLSATHVGHKHSPETRAKMSAAARGNINALGYRHTDEARAKMSSAHIGRKLTDEHRAKLSVAHKGGNNPNWQGDSVGPRGRHGRVHRARGKASAQVCVDCAGRAIDWSQVHRTDGLDIFADYEPRCRRCHIKYDRSAWVRLY